MATALVFMVSVVIGKGARPVSADANANQSVVVVENVAVKPLAVAKVMQMMGMLDKTDS